MLWWSPLFCMIEMRLLDLGLSFGSKALTAKSWVHQLWKQGSYKDHYALHWLSNWVVYVYKSKDRKNGLLSHVRVTGNCLKPLGVWLLLLAGCIGMISQFSAPKRGTFECGWHHIVQSD
ncbi:hypothetical protein HanLR1_Chr11g0391521 [Helianthus annuus]|nr:hypothetical protein HanHA89_Chr11g0414181 [Helianthus annuus]KAJ0684468.1 hypothetical protein HanLR1_Chr11g0391521 [Helianthus annuus]